MTKIDSKLLSLLLCIFFLAPATAAIFPIGPGPMMREHVNEGPRHIFPELLGSNLEGKEQRLPADFDKDLNLLVIAFKRKQQANINTWIESYQKLLESSTDLQEKLAFYELPTIKKMNMFIRFNINNGMRYGINDKKQRERTVTFYLEKESFKKRLAIESEQEIVTMLVNRAGDILWRNQGPSSPEKLDSLKEVLEDVI